MTIEKVNMKSKQEKLLLFSPAIFFQEGIIMMVKKIDAIRTKELMDELRFGTDASACFKMLFLVLSAQENIAGLVGKTEAQEVHIIGNVTAREAKELRMTVNVKEPQAATIFLSTIPADITQSDSSVSVLDTYYKMYGIIE